MKHEEWKRILYVKMCSVSLVAGMMVILYPCIASAWNSHTQSRAIQSYHEKVMHADVDAYTRMWEKAEQFNETVIASGPLEPLCEEETEQYATLLSQQPDGMIGYIEIPSIDCRLPIYHGTDGRTLACGAGHIEWSSLPVGGKNTHCLISGHSGLPGAVLFNHLSEVKEKDIFTLYVLDRVMTYEVYRIETCLPEDTSFLGIEAGEDLCTLITCTPYGINSHRLLVTGRRVYGGETVNDSPTSERDSFSAIYSAGIVMWAICWLYILRKE